jgi:ParB family chromosome partitioning protein
MASTDDIRANHFQPRRDFDEIHLQELAQSIRSSGIIQPLVVRKTGKDGYELIAGERRLRAARLAGLKMVPIVIRKSSDREALELALIENIQRQNLNCVDEALAYFQLIQDFALTQEEVSERVGKDRATVSNYLRLLRLPEIIIEDLKRQVLSFGHGKALLGLEEPELRLKARAQIIDKRLSVRETEALIDMMKKAAQPQSPQGDSAVKTPLASRLANLTRELGRFWSTKVEVKGNDSQGKIIIHYSSRQELDRLVEGMHTKKV